MQFSHRTNIAIYACIEEKRSRKKTTKKPEVKKKKQKTRKRNLLVTIETAFVFLFFHRIEKKNKNKDYPYPHYLCIYDKLNEIMHCIIELALPPKTIETQKTEEENKRR